MGWDKSSTAAVPSYYPGNVLSVEEDVTLYAVWGKVVRAEKIPPTPSVEIDADCIVISWNQEEDEGYYLWREDTSLSYQDGTEKLNNGEAVYSGYVEWRKTAGDL